MNMPRQSRIDTSGALHHVICRGIDRQKIFTDQNDYLLFLKRLAALLTETRTSCIAWALIPNPFHLLLRTGNVPISLLMKRRLTGYNALPAARRAYSRFVQSGIEQGRRPDLTGGGLLRSHGGGTGIKALRATGDDQKGDERIWGDGTFVSEVLDKAEERFKEAYRLRARGDDLDPLIKRVAQITQVTPDEIFDSLRDAKRTKARSILCYWATEKPGIPQSRLAQLLSRTQSAITYAVRRGKALVEDNSYRIE
jgi:REP element-mobilizing transposase RayT